VEEAKTVAKTVNTQEKQKFILWFLRNHRLQSEAVYSIFEYLLTDPDRLARVHFVHDIAGLPVGMVISTICCEGPAFFFRQAGEETIRPAEALAYLQANPATDVFVSLLFHERESSPEYNKVVLQPVEFSQLPLPVENQGLEAPWLDELILQAQKAHLYYRIDKALDQHDREAFFHLVRLLKEHPPSPNP
jgi:uncharacterized protein YpiB (UPF0302 family)